jgi:hypothetical protein
VRDVLATEQLHHLVTFPLGFSTGHHQAAAWAQQEPRGAAALQRLHFEADSGYSQV